MAGRPILCYVTDRRALAGAAGGAAADGAAHTADDAGTHAGAAGETLIDALIERIGAAARAGVDWIQIREKDLTARELSELVRRALAAAGGAGARIIVNDRLDIAVACGAGGVHLARESLPAEAVVPWVRARFSETVRSEAAPGGAAPAAAALAGAPFLVGVSTHSPAEAEAAARAGADYIFFGPVYATPAKLRFGPPQGIEKLADVCRRVSRECPVIAIGGVTEANAAACLAAGAAGVAAIRLFGDADSARRGGLPALVARLRGG